MATPFPATRTLALAAMAGFAIANTFTLQPLLPEILHGLGTAPAAAGWLASAAPLGYTLGMVLVVPLGDRYDLGRLITAQMLALCAATAAAAVAPDLSLLAIAAMTIGLAATVAAQCSAYGARHAGSGRGRVIGAISTGISLGILVGRTLGGALGQLFGWRAMELCMALASFGVALASRRLVAPSPPSIGLLTYAGLLRSLPTAFVTSPTLRLSTAAGSAWFCMFNALWSCLALHLAAPPFGYGPAAAGAFGLVGVAGAGAARAGGWATDRLGTRHVVAVSLACVAGGLSTMSIWSGSLAGLVVGMVLVDVGCFAAQAANQVRILGPGRNSAFSVYMFCYYTAGTVGALAGPAIYGAWGWRALMMTGLALTLGAALAVLAGPGESKPASTSV